MASQADPIPSETDLANATSSFVKAFDAWARRTSVVSTGESEPRLRLLYELHCNGPRKMTDLADVLGVTPRNITALVDGLEVESLVRRTGHPSDRRVTMVEITDGATVEKQFSAFLGMVTELFDGLDEADRRTLVRVFSELEGRIGRSGGSVTTKYPGSP